MNPRRVALGIALLFLGMLVVWFGGPPQGVNGATLLGFALGITGVVLAWPPDD